MIALGPLEYTKLGASAVLVVLGFAVLARMRRVPSAVAFGVWAIAGAFNSSADVISLWGSTGWLVVRFPASVVSTLSLACLVALFPTPLAKKELRWIGLLSLVTFGVNLLWAWTDQVVTGTDQFLSIGNVRGPAALAYNVWSSYAFGFWMLILGVLAWRLRRSPADDAAGARSIAILALGLTIPGAPNLGWVLDVARGHGIYADVGFHSLFFGGVLFAWIAATRGAHGRTARNVTLVMAASFFAGSVLFLVDPTAAWDIGAAIGALLLAYAVLRGQVEGLDPGLRFAISKSTIAAVFIAVFFVASAIAQQFFSDRLGGTYVGIVAAGLLVFAIAPLQRAAERLAERAVPLPSPSALPSSGKEEAYRHALRFALSDRVLTADERIRLAHVADELGLTARRAAEIEADVAREAV